MKLKLDENLPFRLVDELSNLGHDVDTVPNEGLEGRLDSFIWQAAQESNRFLITGVWATYPKFFKLPIQTREITMVS